MNFEKSNYHNDIADLTREILSRHQVAAPTADSSPPSATTSTTPPSSATGPAGYGKAAESSGGALAKSGAPLSDADGAGFDAALWRDLAKADILSAALPESLGGAGLGLLEQCTVLTEIGRAVAPAPYLASIVLGASAIAEFGTDYQRRRWAEPTARGELLLTAALQEDTAEDPRSPTTTATRTPFTPPPPRPDASAPAEPHTSPPPRPDASAPAKPHTSLPPHPNVPIAQSVTLEAPPERVNCAIGTSAGVPTGERGGEMAVGHGQGAWVVSGVKTAVWAAPWADAMLVPAATPDGVAVFVVERSDAGVRIEAQELTDGVTVGRVVLDDVILGDDRLLGTEVSGPNAVAGWLAARGTVGLCALQVGVTERALELTAEHARNRVQFGRPIGSFQAVAQRLADAWIDVEAIRLTMWQAAWLLQESQSGSSALEADSAVATAKFWAADAGHRVAHTAVHVHGGLGIDASYLLNRYFAAAKHHEFALGGAMTQLRRIGTELAKALQRTKFA